MDKRREKERSSLDANVELTEKRDEKGWDGGALILKKITNSNEATR